MLSSLKHLCVKRIPDLTKAPPGLEVPQVRDKASMTRVLEGGVRGKETPLHTLAGSIHQSSNDKRHLQVSESICPAGDEMDGIQTSNTPTCFRVEVWHAEPSTCQLPHALEAPSIPYCCTRMDLEVLAQVQYCLNSGLVTGRRSRDLLL